MIATRARAKNGATAPAPAVTIADWVTWMPTVCHVPAPLERSKASSVPSRSNVSDAV
ncbi:hypothetical protein BMS3Bbin02_00431 [bacterium BMS3Bbin02]|nr:hypothetical protein BMS3Bbin02_00431 [bacterium BMS3Bbin02]